MSKSFGETPTEFCGVLFIARDLDRRPRILRNVDSHVSQGDVLPDPRDSKGVARLLKFFTILISEVVCANPKGDVYRNLHRTGVLHASLSFSHAALSRTWSDLSCRRLCLAGHCDHSEEEER